MSKLRFCVFSTAFFCACGAFAALTDLTWKGDPGADLLEPSSWEENATPTASHRLVFDGDATPVIAGSDKVYCGAIWVKSGTVAVTTTVNDGRFIVQVADNNELVVDVAEGATFDAAVKINGVFNGTGVKTYVKKGGGTFLSKVGFANHEAVRVEEGTLEAAMPSSGVFVAHGHKLTIGSGALVRTLSNNFFADTAIIDIAAGGVIDLNGKDAMVAGVIGAGVVTNSFGNPEKSGLAKAQGGLTLTLHGGPFTFSGRMADVSLGVKRYGGTNIRATTEEEFGFIVGSAETLADLYGTVSWTYDTSLADPVLKDPKNSWLRFAPGIGTFHVASRNLHTTLCGYIGHPLCLQDLAGEPVTLYARVSNEQIKILSTRGSGSFYICGYNVSVLGSNLRHEGALGVGTPLENSTVFGDASTAGNDFDFSTLSTLDATLGPMRFRNVNGSVIPGQIMGSQTLQFDTATTIGELNTVEAAMEMLADLTVNGGHFIAKNNPGFNYGAAGLTLTVNGGEFSRPYTVQTTGDSAFSDIPLPRSVLPSSKDNKGYNQQGSIVQNGGDFYLLNNNAFGARRMELNGGRLHLQTSPFLHLPTTTTDDPTVFAFNGGELVVSRKDVFYYQDQNVFEDSEALALKVGAKGAKITDELVVVNVANHESNPIVISRPFVSDVADGVDGGVQQRGVIAFRYDRPWSITGPFMGEGGTSIIPSGAALAADGSFFGSGDTVLRNHAIKLQSRTEPYAFRPHGNGRKLTVDGAALIALRSEDDKGAVSATVDALEFEPGGVLFLHDHGLLGEGSSTFKLKTVPEVLPNGRVNLPVFGTRSKNMYYLAPMGYSAENGFTNLTTFASTFGPGAIVDINAAYRTVSAGQAVVADMLVSPGSGCQLTLGEGASLTLGDGVNPAYCYLSRGGIYGSGQLSFGASPAVVVCGTYDEFDCSGIIDVPITAANGLSVVALPDINIVGWRGVRLTKANTYSGVTRVASAIIQAEHPNCFSAGDVYVTGGDKHGGGVRFNKAGAVWNNGFHIAGRGIRKTYFHRTGDNGFALQFSADGELAGDVELGSVARVGTTTNENVKAVISGTVSGGKLELAYSKGWLRLTGANTYSGGTDVIQSNLEIARGDSLGSGEVWLANGVLRFVNDEPVVFTNYVKGVGEIVLAGAPVTFAGRAFDALPVKTLAKGTVLKYTQGYALRAGDVAASTLKEALVLDGDVTLYGDVTVDSVWGSGTVSGGVVTVTGAIDPDGTLTFAETPVLAGATLTVRTSDGAVDKVVVPDDFDLTGLKLVVEQVGLPVVFPAKAFLETSGALSGSFATVTLPAKRTKNYSVDVGSAAATLSYQKPGALLIVR